MAFRNANGPGELRWGWRVHRREESSVFHQDLLTPLGMGTEREERPQQVVCFKAGGPGFARAEREREELRLVHLLHWPTCFSVMLDWEFLRECWLELGILVME